MFRGTPPFLRVALRHRRWAILGAPLAALTFLYCSYHPGHYRFSPPTEHVGPEALSPFPHDVSIVQADPGEFPDYYWDTRGHAPSGNNGRSSSSGSSDQKEEFVRKCPFRLLSTAGDNARDGNGCSLSSHEEFALPPSQPTFTPGIPKPLNEAYTKAIVIAHTKSENVDWVNDPILNSPPTYSPNTRKENQRTNTTKWTPYLYVTDDISPLASGSEPSLQLHFHTPLNKGRESLAYLSYIISHYDSLPEISVFMHAHPSSWHDDQFGLDSPTTLSRLNLDRVITQGYMNLRCWWDPGCPDHIHPFTSSPDELKPEESFFREAWLDLFPWRDVPPSISQTCCGQFALSRERIKSVNLAEYIRLRDWILGTELEDSVSGRVFEYIWQVIWTGYEILCPVEWVCYCEGYGICFWNDGDEDEGEVGEEGDRGGEQRKKDNREEEKRKRGYEEYSLKRDEWMGLSRIVEEFVEGEEGSSFSIEDIWQFADRVEGGEAVDDVVRDAVEIQGHRIGHGQGDAGGGSGDENGNGIAVEGRREENVKGVGAEDQDIARRLVEVIKASRKANKVLLPWLMDKMGEAKGEK